MNPDINSENKQIATVLWQVNSKKNIPCGYGSKLQHTEMARVFIQECIYRFKIQSINDAGCGDFSWMKLLDLKDVKYSGFDINSQMIDALKEAYSDVNFFEHDFVNKILPKADLIVCRDCLFHLPFKSIFNALKLFKESGAKWLITTSHNEQLFNIDLADVKYSKRDSKYYNEHYGFRELNLRMDPFNLPKPIDSIDENPTYNRILAIWELQEILNG